MTWTRLGDDFTDRPAMLGISRSARMLLVEMLVWSNRMLTDGRIPAGAVRRLTDADDPDQDLKELLGAELAQLVDDEVGRAYLIDWSEQEEGDTVRERKQASAERSAKYRDRVTRHARGDHSRCDPRRCPAARVTRDALRDATRDVTRHDTTSLPDPARPSGRVGDRGRSSGSAGAPPAAATEASPAPHEFVPDPIEAESYADDCMYELSRPCTACGQSYDHAAHSACDFIADPERPERCGVCGEGEEAPWHHYVYDLLAAAREKREAAAG